MQNNDNEQRESKERKKIPRLLRIGLGIIIGGGLGYAYYYFIGCNGGTCPITGNPWNSTTTGMVLGLIWTIK
ncbi:MAG: hypothetical protein PWQ06_1067 [Anaerophaga sp.]|uniref:DUF6132 family protein n=1 Tax=Anaerophaga thermohalophila TaxID=177400 RepID=UPI000237BACF|nr:DUF6132 family protein [Anaerophaga thermohalophila]MDI3520663.1 hypothetical protein [Anaerophaga sp.]MDN5290828.1 hypothetical protein [Anaerophaga sp.]